MRTIWGHYSKLGQLYTSESRIETAGNFEMWELEKN
jgi:hypothetical protein